jgi:D-alanyl-D-alanine endopeptidase (penicillin-binding protein 7)
MPSSKKQDFRLALLVAAAVAAAGLLPLAYRYGWEKRAAPPDTPVATAPGSAQPGTGTEPEATVPSPPGTEVVPPEESETDRGATSASPAGPTLSFGRAAGLHLTPDPLHLNSSAALVMDQDTGQVLAQKNDNVVLPVASLTKVMTALLVVEAKQPMDEVLTITEEDVDKERNSRSRLKIGSTLTREEALRLALMSSENRAAHALGRTYPGGLTKMVEAMNARARALGMQNTRYVDPTGLSNENRSTARDVATLVAVAGKHPVIRDFSTTPTHLAELSGRTLQYRNSNRLVRSEESGWEIALQKTGYIVEAGRCLTMLANVAGHNLIMVLLDADTNGARVADAQRLRKWVVAQNGWRDEAMLAKAEADRERVAAAKQRAAAKAEQLAAAKARKADKLASAKGAGKAGKATARSGGGKARTEVASASKGKPVAKQVAASGKSKNRKDVAVARKAEPKKAGRVSKTFAAARPEQKG